MLQPDTTSRRSADDSPNDSSGNHGAHANNVTCFGCSKDAAGLTSDAVAVAAGCSNDAAMTTTADGIAGNDDALAAADPGREPDRRKAAVEAS